MSKFYILKDRTPIFVEDVAEWGKWFETADKQVALDELDGIIISTVFLGIEHADGMLFETMIFDGPSAPTRQCYRTCAEAEHRHQELVARVKQAQAEECAAW